MLYTHPKLPAEFFEHFRSYLDSKIEEFYSMKSGRKVKFERIGNQLSVPAEYALTWKLNYKDLVDTEEFIRDYEPKKFKTPGKLALLGGICCCTFLLGSSNLYVLHW